MSRIKKFEMVRQWAKERGLTQFGDPKTQSVKMMEELGEFSQSLLRQDPEGMKDALGDMQVVLINLATQCGYKLEDCLDAAWDEIKDRKGKMQGGSFVKNS